MARLASIPLGTKKSAGLVHRGSTPRPVFSEKIRGKKYKEAHAMKKTKITINATRYLFDPIYFIQKTIEMVKIVFMS